jgi:CelD/BcsL family acetyltransferase involved in cellulose biosynthesis
MSATSPSVICNNSNPIPPEKSALPWQATQGAVSPTAYFKASTLLRWSLVETHHLEWQQLLMDSRQDSLFMAYSWMSAWAKQFITEQPLFITVRDDQNQLVAMAPLQISKGRRGLFRRSVRSLQFMGTEPDVFDWMTIPMHPSLSPKQKGRVLALIGAEIMKAKDDWDVLDLRFCTHLGVLEGLRHVLSPVTHTSTLTPGMPMPFMDCPADVETYQKDRKRRLRKAISNSLNKLKADHKVNDLEFVVVEPGKATDKAIARFFKHHAAYWQAKGVKTDARRFDGVEAFYKAVAHTREPYVSPYATHTNQCRFMVSHLMHGNTVVSAHLGTWQGLGQHKRYLAHLCNYNQDYMRYRAGMLHFDKLIAFAISQGVTQFEFGRGDEDYKALWTQTKTETHTLKLAQTAWGWQRLHADDWLRGLLSKQPHDTPCDTTPPEATTDTEAVA